jgi:hypothetical protein
MQSTKISAELERPRTTRQDDVLVPDGQCASPPYQQWLNPQGKLIRQKDGSHNAHAQLIG